MSTGGSYLFLETVTVQEESVSATQTFFSSRYLANAPVPLNPARLYRYFGAPGHSHRL